jgi:hypothetical protein
MTPIGMSENLTLFNLSTSSLLLLIVCLGGRNGFDFGGIGGMMARWESDLAVVGEEGMQYSVDIISSLEA